MGKSTGVRPSKEIFIGKIFHANSGWQGEVMQYNNCHSVFVKWQDGSAKELADKWEGKIDPRAHAALINYTV